MSDDFRSAWEEAVALYRAEKAENARLRVQIEELMAADRDHLAAKNGMEKRLSAEIERLRAEVSRSSYHCD
jgi:hypothetical protein